MAHATVEPVAQFYDEVGGYPFGEDGVTRASGLIKELLVSIAQKKGLRRITGEAPIFRFRPLSV